MRLIRGGRIVAVTAGTALGAVGVGQLAAASSAGGFDTNGDGIIDQIWLDSWDDGSADLYLYDVDQNGWFESVSADTDNDGYREAAAWDTNGDGVFDLADFDTNLDGYFDSPVTLGGVDIYDAILGNTFVGAPTNPGAFYTMMTSMAAVSGGATYGTPDSDCDGYHDGVDPDPWNPSLC